MLTITVNLQESWDEKNECFIGRNGSCVLQLEHSLVSISKWESKWNKSFMANSMNLTSEETVYYIKCMTLNKSVPDDIYNFLSKENVRQITEYISAPMTATWFAEDKNKTHSREVVTSELIYYWMTAFNIPFECQKWHLNRLLTLIRVCNVKSQPGKKMSKRETASQYAALNAARRKKYNTRG